MLDLGLEKVKSHIKTIGLFNSKAKHIIATCERLVSEHQGQVPDDRNALQALAGVGRKTANVVLNTAFGHPTLAVDTHIFRVAHRLQLSSGKTPDHVEKDLLKVIPKSFYTMHTTGLFFMGVISVKRENPYAETAPSSLIAIII